MSLLFGVPIAVGLVVGLAAPASAVVPLPDPLPNPGSQASLVCDPGGTASVLLTNVGGTDFADFVVFVTQNGFGQQAAHLAPNTSAIRTFDLIENGGYVVHIKEASGYTNDVSLDTVDCYGVQGTLTATCVDEQLVLDVAASPTKSVEDLWWELDGTIQMKQTTAFTDSVIIPQGAAFAAKIRSEHDGVVTQLSGVADCAVPVTTIGSTTVPTTMPAAIPTTTPTTGRTTATSLPTVLAEIPSTPAAGRPTATSDPVADLPVTGRRETGLTLVASLVLAAGLALLVATRRPAED